MNLAAVAAIFLEFWEPSPGMLSLRLISSAAFDDGTAALLDDGGTLGTLSWAIRSAGPARATPAFLPTSAQVPAR